MSSKQMAYASVLDHLEKCKGANKKWVVTPVDASVQDVPQAIFVSFTCDAIDNCIEVKFRVDDDDSTTFFVPSKKFQG